MKKYLLGTIAAAALVAPSAWAFVCNPYLSVSAGRDLGSWRFSNELGSSDSNVDRLRGWSGNYFGGCDFVFNKFSIAAEVGGGAANSKVHIDSTNADSDDYFEFHNYWAVGLVPSYSINGEQVFARIMAAWAKLQYKTDVTDQKVYRFNGYQDGGIFGVGILAPISGHFAIRNEYDHSFYSKISKTASGSTLSWRPVQDVYTLGLTYYFESRFSHLQLSPLSHGLYFGIGGGRDLPSYYRKQITSSNVVVTWRQGLHGWVAHSLLGYDFLPLGRFDFALESMASYSSAFYKEGIANNTPRSYQYYLKDMYALRAKVGVDSSASNELFVLGGGALAHFTKTGGERFGRNFDTYKPGWQIGLGDQFALTGHLSARLEGDYAKFESIKNVGNDGSNFRWSPTDERATMTLMYSFG